MSNYSIQKLRAEARAKNREAFSGTNGKTCAFYHHPYVERFTSMNEMIASLLTKEGMR